MSSLMGLLLRGFGTLTISAPAAAVVVTDGKLPDLSKAVALYLTENSSGLFAARHNADVVYPMDQLNNLKVDVWPQSLDRPVGTRTRWSRMPIINVAVQRRAPSQEEKDVLINMVDDMLQSLLGQRFLNDIYYCNDGSFGGGEIMDRFEHYETNVFVSVLSVNFQRFL